MPSNSLILCCPLLLLPSVVSSIRVLPKCWLFASGGQSIGASTSASVLPMSILGWFHLRLTGFLSFQSKGLSRIFSSTSLKASVLHRSVFFMIHLSHPYIIDPIINNIAVHQQSQYPPDRRCISLGVNTHPLLPPHHIHFPAQVATHFHHIFFCSFILFLVLIYFQMYREMVSPFTQRLPSHFANFPNNVY